MIIAYCGYYIIHLFHIQIDRQIANATSYLIEVWANYTTNKEGLCSYGIALAAFALAEQPTDKSVARSEMIMELKTRIQRESGKESCSV